MKKPTYLQKKISSRSFFLIISLFLIITASLIVSEFGMSQIRSWGSSLATNVQPRGKDNLALVPAINPPYFVTYVNEVTTWWPPESLAAGLGVPGYAPGTGYNIFLLTFWTETGPMDTALVWQNPTAYFGTQSPFGSTNAAIRQNILNAYHNAGKKLLVSAFGWGPTPTTSGRNATTVCTSLANWVLANSLDGVDLDYEDFGAMENGTAEAWLIECTRAIRNVLPSGQYLLTHSPVAPWFAGNGINPGGGYTYIHQQVGDLIDWYNIQFYNQDNNRYDTYTTLFTQSGGYYSGTSVKEIMDKGVPASKVLILKPSIPADAVNTGYVTGGDLSGWIQTFRNSFPSYGWSTGMGTWQYKNDYSGGYPASTVSSLISANTPDTTDPSVPTGLVATAISSSQINLSWNPSTDNASGVAGYILYRNGTMLISTVNRAYSDNGLSANTSYSYTVAAYDAAGNVSDQSASASVTTKPLADTIAPAAITDLSVVSATPLSVTLSFTAPGDDGNTGTATSYDVRYSMPGKRTKVLDFNTATRASGEPAPQAAGSQQTYTLTGLKAGASYYIGMKTTDDAGNVSPVSNVVLVNASR